jgi:hypothetical protein
MDWPLIIERNRERILIAIAQLLAVLGYDHRRRGGMPRHVRLSWLTLLRPAESAVRSVSSSSRRAARAIPKGLGKNWGLPTRTQRAFLPSVSSTRSGALPRTGLNGRRNGEKTGAKY